jgi:hypothetical protein
VGPALGFGSKLQPSYLEFSFKKKTVNAIILIFDPYSNSKYMISAAYLAINPLNGMKRGIIHNNLKSPLLHH